MATIRTRKQSDGASRLYGDHPHSKAEDDHLSGIQDLRAADCRGELGEASGSGAREAGLPVPSAARYTDARGLRAAKNVKELLVHPEITQEARSACRELRLVGKPRRRARRPAPDELARLREYFASRDRRAQIPMQAIVDFAIASPRREAEICRLEWRDNDGIARTGLVRDAKHPTSKEGNHRRFKNTPEAWAIIESAPAGLLIAHPEVLGSYAARAGCWLRQTRLIARNRCYSRY